MLVAARRAPCVMPMTDGCRGRTVTGVCTTTSASRACLVPAMHNDPSESPIRRTGKREELQVEQWDVPIVFRNHLGVRIQ